jgi:hypothetical protein
MGEELLAPAASFQLLTGTTPATSELAIGVVLKPTKSMLITPTEELDEVMVRVAVTEWLSDPLLPLIARVELPAGVLPVVVTVSVELVPGVIDVGLKAAVVPLGRPLTDKFTVPVNPFNAEALTV